ncbi:MAG: hypothetical protein B7X81_09125 [Hydrogenophilales bacterium 17-61-76]|nr:MAG: hypothetical protein B7X81_09125 [Hydrogenophilales bacterium 17-61-76]
MRFQAGIEIIYPAGVIEILRRNAENTGIGRVEFSGAEVVERGVALGQLDAEGIECVIGAVPATRMSGFCDSARCTAWAKSSVSACVAVARVSRNRKSNALGRTDFLFLVRIKPPLVEWTRDIASNIRF